MYGHSLCNKDIICLQ